MIATTHLAIPEKADGCLPDDVGPLVTPVHKSTRSKTLTAQLKRACGAAQQTDGLQCAAVCTTVLSCLLLMAPTLVVYES